MGASKYETEASELLVTLAERGLARQGDHKFGHDIWFIGKKSRVNVGGKNDQGWIKVLADIKTAMRQEGISETDVADESIARMIESESRKAPEPADPRKLGIYIQKKTTRRVIETEEQEAVAAPVQIARLLGFDVQDKDEVKFVTEGGVEFTTLTVRIKTTRERVEA